MKKILEFIPGFRTNVKWKMIVASIYYLSCLTLLTSGIGIFLFGEAIPFFIFYGIKALKIRKRQNITLAIVAFMVMGLGLGLMPKTVDTTAQNKVASSSNVTKSIPKKSSKNASTKKAEPKVEPKAEITTASTATNKTPTVTGQLKIHYIDVGQGDSELIQSNGQNMLIDTGTNASTSSLISYLQNQNIKKIDYLVLTHPHEDHVGGADTVIKTFDIGTIYMPQVTTNTKTFKDVVAAMQSKGLKATQPALGTTLKIGDSNCIVYGPVGTNSKDLNTYSIVIKLTFGNNKFLFTGDTQSSNEEGMINNGYDLSSDVLKVAHHGSDTSTSQDFLDKVNPKYAIISCGKNNDYGHPHEVTMDKLKAKGVKVYRTDENGTIVCTSDGNNISFNCNPGDYANGGSVKSSSGESSTTTQKTTATPTPVVPVATPQPNVSSNSDKSVTVYITATGKKYHLAGCRELRKSSIAISLDKAKAEGYTPCKICNPPQ